MAVVKYKKADGTFTPLPFGGSMSPSWDGLTGKPFDSIDSTTLSINADGVLTVVGGGGNVGTDMTESELENVWDEVFGGDE